MTRPKQIAWWSTGGFAAFLLASVLFTTWPIELFQLPLVINDAPRAANVVIVLGAGARKHGDPLPPQAKERVRRGVSLVRQGYAPTLLVAGGLSKQSGYVEAELMKTYAVSLGIASDQVVVEDRSINTWENAVNSIAIMQRNEWRSALVVTSPYHTLRSCTIFHKLHATVRCVSASLNTIPTDTVYERLTDFRSVIREYGAIVYFVLKHYI